MFFLLFVQLELRSTQIVFMNSKLNCDVGMFVWNQNYEITSVVVQNEH